jgi:O-glycosyl hydrolase
MKKSMLLIIPAVIIMLCQSCKDNNNGDGDEPNVYTFTIDPSVTFQEMIGFGGSLTWYSDRITSSPNKDKICQLLFEDLGPDMVRFKNNYYPQGYPAVKTTNVMENPGLKTLFTSTNQLADIARQYNPDIQFLVSSWTPPSALKSNNNLREGTLKKDAGVFMYEQFGEYWNDVLDHLTFNPDYISIQNEPGWITPDWETCEWRGTETASFPGYVNAFDAVYNRISTRVNPPKMIGPEAENIGYSGKLGDNTFAHYSDPIKNKPFLAAYGYHTYNYQASALISSTKGDLNMIRDSYGNKPCIMTEYSNFTWLNTAHFILQNINEANASGYLYWLMSWGSTDDKAMIMVASDGSYTITPFYYVMKHFSKYIDRGYDRISATVSSSSLITSAFIDPAADKITVIIVNPLNVDADAEFTIKNSTVKSVSAVQTCEGSYFKDLGTISDYSYIRLKPFSVTTAVFDI